MVKIPRRCTLAFDGLLFPEADNNDDFGDTDLEKVVENILDQRFVVNLDDDLWLVFSEGRSRVYFPPARTTACRLRRGGVLSKRIQIYIQYLSK